jgi:hypothetical protein
VEGQRKRKKKNCKMEGKETKHVLDVEEVGQEPFLLSPDDRGILLISGVLLGAIW